MTNKTFVQRKTLGLALGSGGWRGQAHIGVIKALVEAGIRIDYIAGASAGALVGGAYASLENIEQVEQIFKDESTKKTLRYAFSDPKLKWGVFQGKRITKIITNVVGDKKIEDLTIPFCALATDLLTGQVVEIKKGSLPMAIRASASVPFVFEPLEYQSYRLIDGGTAVPIPVKTVQQMGAQVAIAVNLYKNIFPVRAKQMSPIKAVLKTSQVMLYHLAQYSCQTADFVLEPDIQETQIYSNPFSGFVNNKGVSKVGEKVVQENLEAIRQLLS